MDKELIINKLKENKATLERNFNISKIGLFGSYSIDASNKESDIDLIYELKEGKRLGLKEIHQLETFFKNLFNLDKVDIINHRYVNPIIENEINKSVIYV